MMKVFKWLGVVGIIALVGLGARNLAPKAKTALFLWQENRKIESELGDLKDEQEEAAERLRQLAVPRFIEREARIRLQLRRPGEEVAVIVPPEATSAPMPTQAADAGIRRAWQFMVQWSRRFLP